jgi:hypothetical protein
VYKSKGLRRHISALLFETFRVLASFGIKRNFGTTRFFQRKNRDSAAYYCTSKPAKEKFILLGNREKFSIKALKETRNSGFNDCALKPRSPDADESAERRGKSRRDVSRSRDV